MVTGVVFSDAAHLAVGLALVAVAVFVVYALDRPDGAWTRAMRSRFLYGVPWGTLISLAVVVAVYLFVQDGISNPYRPVVIPFRSWSYFYPEGLLWAGLAHSGLGHLTGNLLSALVAGGIAEYAYGHGAGGRDRTTSITDNLLDESAGDRALVSNPYVRAFVVVPGAILGFAVLSSLFTLGPVIGFSTAVFALWGFALVHYPVRSLAALTGPTLASVVYWTLRSPVALGEASGSYGPPGWANVAVQGHALGLIVGALAAVWLVRRRREKGSGSGLDFGSGFGSDARSRVPTGDGRSGVATLAVFGCVLLFGASRRLWAIYWYLGGERFELYRALGLGLFALLAAIVAVAAVGRDEPLWPDRAVSRSETVRDAVRSATPAAVGLLCLLAALAAVAGPAVVPNLVTVDDGGDLPGDPIEINGYQITYAENVENRLVSAVDVEAFGRSTSVNTSGVIVSNPDREIWTTAVSRGNLAFWGYRAVDVGGTGWRETVWIQRTGWVAAGGETAYRVDAIRNETRSTLFASEPARVDGRIDGRNASIAPVDEGFELRVEHEERTEAAPLPATNESVTVLGISVVREESRVYAERDGTRIQIARQEQYEGRQ
ncbi:rhomboid family intramembrane serine protease [Halorubrum laminariae]|uniref:Rhomboid family intramembrane serine protease n=1 Tax=Halorubrum laminariae TaxID=1433523 RepID=A0ABD6C5T2_9EURY|nr:rhomboid family intramembrane serine protease [Halorubrum laminariae]